MCIYQEVLPEVCVYVSDNSQVKPEPLDDDTERYS